MSRIRSFLLQQPLRKGACALNAIRWFVMCTDVLVSHAANFNDALRAHGRHATTVWIRADDIDRLYSVATRRRVLYDRNVAPVQH